MLDHFWPSEGLRLGLSRRSINRRQFLAGASALAATTLLSTTACNSTDSTVDATTNSNSSLESYEITDQLDKTITFDAVPERVAMTVMPLPSIFYAVMGDTDQLVGVNPSSITAYQNSTLTTLYPSLADASTGWCGTDFSVNIEELLLLEPDVVFQWATQSESIEKMEDAGLKVVALKNGSIEDLWSWISILGSIFQKTDRANWLIDYFKDSVDEISTQVEEISDADKPSALVLYDDLKVSTLAGAQAYWLENSGAKNLIDGFASGSSSIDMEQVLTWNPDVIYISNFTTLNPSDLIQNTLSGEDWSPVKAVQSGSVYKIPIGGYRWDPPSVETPLMVRWLAKIQHPDLFSSMDMGNELKKFYQDVYDYDMSDDMVSQVLDHTQE